MIPRIPQQRVLNAAAAATWTVSVGAIAADLLDVGPDIPDSLIILGVAAATTLTVAAIAERIRRAVTYLARTAIVPVKEAFLHGVQYNQAQTSTGTAKVIALPRQPYATADPRPEPQTADGVTTVELSRLQRRPELRPRRRR